MNKLMANYVGYTSCYGLFMLSNYLTKNLLERGVAPDLFYLIIGVPVTALIITSPIFLIIVIINGGLKGPNEPSYKPDNYFKRYFFIISVISICSGTLAAYINTRMPSEVAKIIEKENADKNQAKMLAEKQALEKAAKIKPESQTPPSSSKLPSISSIFESNDKGMKELKLLEQRWYDAIELASSTPRISLSGPISNLQSISRDLEATEVSECLDEAKNSLSVGMKIMVKANLEFLGQNELLANSLYEKATNEFNNYKQLRDKCL